jgi:hypothetical protein
MRSDAPCWLPARPANLEKPVGIVDIGASALTFAALLRGQVIYSRLQNWW